MTMLLTIETETKRYPVFIGSGAIGKLPGYLAEEMEPISNVWIIADQTVADLYLQRLMNLLSPMFGECIISIVPAGEHCKTMEVFEKCHSDGLKANANRKTVILALGGGAVGDLAGFVAATYMRGIRFVGIPTTLLAHDSAVGGKVAINHPLGKNMIGAFHQPEAVFYDLDFLYTLPEKEWRSGFAEIVKHGLIGNPDFYEWLLLNIGNLKEVTKDQLARMIRNGIEVKASVVKQDERELGIRAYLNFGHTLGHALELNAGYGTMTHGEAVMTGMVFALKMSMEKSGLYFDLNRFTDWIKRLGYMTEVPKGDGTKLLESMKKDKKTTGEKVTFVVLKKLGEPATIKMEQEEVLECIERYF